MQKYTTCTFTEHIWRIWTIAETLKNLFHFLRSFLRSKPLSCQSAEDRETRVTSTTTKRKRSTSRKQKSVRKSLQSSSECARVPPGLTLFFGIFALSGGLRRSRGVMRSKQMPPSFIPHSWMRSFLPWFCVQLALIYTQAHYADTPCAATHKKILDHVLMFSCWFVVGFFSFVVL